MWNLTKQKWKKLMVEKPELIKTDEYLVNEVKKIMEEVRSQCSSLASCHLEKMIECLRGKFV